jgi:hypothetical protein
MSYRAALNAVMTHFESLKVIKFKPVCNYYIVAATPSKVKFYYTINVDEELEDCTPEDSCLVSETILSFVPQFSSFKPQDENILNDLYAFITSKCLKPNQQIDEVQFTNANQLSRDLNIVNEHKFDQLVVSFFLLNQSAEKSSESYLVFDELVHVKK